MQLGHYWEKDSATEGCEGFKREFPEAFRGQMFMYYKENDKGIKQNPLDASDSIFAANGYNAIYGWEKWSICDSAVHYIDKQQWGSYFSIVAVPV